MATKVDTFVTSAEAELSAIRQHFEEIERLSRRLNARWVGLGKQNMVGWLEYNWDGKPYTEAELRSPLNALAVDYTFNAANITVIGGLVDKILKANL